MSDTVLEYKLTWPRNDRNERQHQVFRSEVSLNNKLFKLEAAGYKEIKIYVREVAREPWKEIRSEQPAHWSDCALHGVDTGVDGYGPEADGISYEGPCDCGRKSNE